MKIIDFHAHLQANWLEVPLMSPEEFIAGLDRFNVSSACIFTVMGFYGDSAKENDLLLSHAEQYPERLIPFVTVDPKLGNAAVDEVERCLANPVFRGIKFHPWMQAFAPSMVKSTLTEILHRAVEYDVPVLFHDGTPPYSTTFQIADVARWVPEAKIVLGHTGLADYVYPAGRLLRDLPNLYACFCGPKAGDLPYIVEMAGEDKVIFGSDYGIADWHILIERLDEFTHSGLPEEVLQQVLYDNAARLLHLHDRPL